MTDKVKEQIITQHIAIVSETFPPEINGVANTLRQLCRGLSSRGHRVSVIRPAQSSGTPLSEDERRQLMAEEHTVRGVPLPGYPDLQFGLARSARIRRIWQENRPDAVYVATQGPLGVAAVNAARHLKIPVSSGFHTNFHSYSRYYRAGWLERGLRAYGRWFHNRTALTLAPTRRVASMLSGLGIGPVGIWSRGVDCQRFTPHKRDAGLRQQWGLEPDDRAILYVGRLASEKNLQLASACFERIRSLHPRARFILVGEGPLRDKLSRQHPDYIFCGVREGDDLARHYASGDIFLFPSKTDTFGNVVTEAMASGLAIVSFDDAAAAEHLRHEENGMKASLDDDEAFVEHALTLAQQHTLRSRIRQQARVDALDLDWSTQIEQFEQLTLNLPPRTRYHVVSQGIPLL